MNLITQLDTTLDDLIQLHDVLLETRRELQDGWYEKALAQLNPPTEMSLCQSYYDDANVLQDCTCGRCA
jgi:hypothetical protein